MVTATEEEKKIKIPSFGIEIDHPRNSDVMLQSIVGVRLRSAIDGTKPVYPKEGKDEVNVPIDQIQGLASFPRTPGMEVHVNPAQLKYTIEDPMHGDEDLCIRVQKWLEHNSAYSPDKKINGHPLREGELDVNRMKTLCRELFHLVESGEAKRAKGSVPTMKEIEGLPGRFLLNPGSRVQNTQPMFEDEYDSWVQGISRSGV